AKRVLELLDEEALAADRRKRSIDDAIALGRDAEQFHGRAAVACGKLRADVLGLPERKCRFTRGDREPARRERSGHRVRRACTRGKSIEFTGPRMTTLARIL